VSLAESQLHRAIQDLFIAGTESVSTTLKWAVLFMTLHEEIQLKVQQEIGETVVGLCCSTHYHRVPFLL